MKKLIGFILLASLMALPAFAADATISADFLSAYISKGYVDNDEPVFQPNLEVNSDIGLGFNIWASMDLTNNDKSVYPNTSGEWGEYDLTALWTTPFEEWPVALTAGITYFVYPQDEEADGNYEAFASISASQIILNPTLAIYYDFRNKSDWYGIFSLNHNCDLSDKIVDGLSLDVGGEIGYALSYYGENNYGAEDAGSGFTHAQINVALNYALTEKLTITAKASYVSIIDSDYRDGAELDGRNMDADNFFGGFNVAYTF